MSPLPPLLPWALAGALANCVWAGDRREGREDCVILSEITQIPDIACTGPTVRNKANERNPTWTEEILKAKGYQ